MLKVIELFAGIGAWKKALDNLGIKNKTYAVEKDEDTIKVYNLFYHKNYSKREIQNFITSENLLKFNPNLIVMSPPCQNYSKAKQCSKRETDNLISYTVPIIKKARPRYIVLENVPQFEYSADYLNFSEELILLGYTSTQKVLNPLDHNWPQNRPRFFAIWFYNRSDYWNFNWPEKEELKLSVNDVINFLPSENYKIKPLPVNAKLRKNGNGYIWGKYIDNRCYLPNRYIGTITATFNQPWLLCGNMVRQLTVRECFKLMGFSDDDYYKIKKIFPTISNSKLKRMAGNSIVVPLVEKVLKGLNLKEMIGD